MLQLSACIDMLFPELDFVDRVDAVASAGLPAYEFWTWGHRDLEALRARQRRHGLTLVSMVLEPRFSILEPGRAQAFAAWVREGCRVAQSMDCGALVVLLEPLLPPREEPQLSYPTNMLVDPAREAKQASAVEALRAAAPIAESEGITLLLEPLNWLVDHPDYFLVFAQQGLAMVREVASPAVKLLFDVYHQQVSEGNLIANLTSALELVGYVQVADVPGRHQPGSGEINFGSVLGAARRAGYSGFVGLEYSPLGDSHVSLQHIRSVVEQVNRT